MRSTPKPELKPDAALFLDIDGTLLDLAPHPDWVVVPAGLPDLLRRLRARLGGALALISGRRIEEIDFLFGGGLAVAAEHGALVREAGGTPITRASAGAGLARIIPELAAAVAAHPGALLEQKRFGLAVHWRQAPEAGPALSRLATALAGADPDLMVQPAHAAIEIRASGPGKDGALDWFLARAPFAGRVPIFIGDDATDLPAIALATRRGGVGLHVAEAFGGEAKAVRDWLAGLDDEKGWRHG